ncbi:phosphotriesterase family protein [Alicyclobacillus mengziensis]|uniref:Phosphotriesterase-related protein n=1 Tax=Alicyclobacillus mengziensis TaxID=2931921 RepID=A0A9X7VYK0_9BACL|nr:phosphotriesterase-related protein [Alicyclobacillus mengziensis]QSO47084.1 phosphotriesterase-related protein [Alicyclobacillus mengziensis]
MTHWVNTVTGRVHPNELGKTLMHEHFVFGYPGYQGDLTLGGFNADEALSIGINVAERLLSHGVRTVVDPTPNDCGRNPELLHEISVHTGLQIICATGYYYEGEGAPAYFKMRSSFGDITEEIYEMFMTEITQGIGKTGIKPGVIKLGSSKGVITDYEQAFFRAAARAQRETGVTIVTHTQDGTMGPEQADLLISEGADPVRIVIGHMDGNTDVAYHHETLKRGVTIGFDRFGLQVINNCPMDYLRETVLIGLIGIGYGHKIVLSHDTVNCWCGRPFKVNEQAAALLSKWNPTHIFDEVLPVLREAGITEEQLQQIFEHNPQSVFGG